MKFLPLVLSALLGLSLAEDPVIETDDDVLVLTEKNFKFAIEKYDYVLVEFYAPWCGHCKQLTPEYAKAAKVFKDDDKVALAKVDATEEKDLAQKFGVRGYPTIKWFKGHDSETAHEYGGGRKEPAISQWVAKKTGPATTLLSSVEDANKFKEGADGEDHVVVIGYFPEGHDSADFVATADKMDDVKFGVTSNADVAKELELEAGGITLFKNFDDRFNKFSEGDLLDFVNAKKMRWVTEFTDTSAPKIFGGAIKKHILLFSASSGADHNKIHEEFTAAAKEFLGKVLFVWINCDTPNNGRILEFFGLKEENCPDARMIEMGDAMKKFKPNDSGLDTAAFSGFVSGVLDGSIGQFLMSEEIPEKNDEPVTVIVGKNFKEIAFNDDKHVFIEFYAPWCGHCKQLTPVWEKLGEHFKDRDDVVIAKSDATANEFSEVAVQGFPTLKFFAKGAGTTITDYNGGRDLDSLIKFVEAGGVEAKAEEMGEDEEEDIEEDEDEDDEDYDEEDEEEESEEAEEEQKDEL